MKINDYKSKNGIGSNQYQDKRKWYKNTFLNLLFLPAIFFLVLGVKDLSHNLYSAHAQTIVSPLSKDSSSPLTEPNRIIWHLVEKDSPTVTTEPQTAQQKDIEAYIKQVFGDDADKAIRLLTDPVCHENGSLNPEAVNYNLNSDGSVSSTDWGLFQLNDKWQGFNENAKRFLFDYKINTMMAHKIFEDSGNTFARWTCGAALGI